MRVAVIGTGIAGNATAWTLSKHYPVTVYDREWRPGWHSHTVTIDYDGARIAVDIGFIVYNELNYPDPTALFAHLGVETVESCMSFAVTADTGRFEWKRAGVMSLLVDLDRLEAADRQSPLFGVNRAALYTFN